MADANLLNSIDGEGKEATTSMMLDTLMYTDNLDGYNGYTVGQIIDDMRKNNPPKSDGGKLALANLEAYYKNNSTAPVWDLKLQSSSDSDTVYDGAKGAAFYSGNSKHPSDVYVAFRGTGEGRWYDNGDGLASPYSKYQVEAASYFDYVVRTMDIDESCNVITTGHSKGGNFSQYVAFASKNAALVDKVVSYDGQGFSPEAQEYFKSELGPELYEEQRQKMYSISGDQDYVNVLGDKVIPDDHTVYIKTDRGDFYNAHALFTKDEGDGTIGNLFDYKNGGFLPTTTEQKGLALIAAALSAEIMKKDPKERAAICHTVMSALEFFMPADAGEKGYKYGLNGEVCNPSEILETIKQIPGLIKNVGVPLFKEKMAAWLESLKNSSAGQFIGHVTAAVVSAVRDKAIPGAKAVLDTVHNWVSDKIQKGKEAIKDFGNGVLEAGKSFCEGVKDNYNKLVDFVTGGRNSSSSSSGGGHGGHGGAGSLVSGAIQSIMSNLFDGRNSADVVIDDGAIVKAASDLDGLSQRLQTLRNDIEGMLNDLKAGFDTPAGRKFINSCENNLLTPLDQQKLVIDHISQNLQSVKTCYSSVFSEYQQLTSTISSYQS